MLYYYASEYYGKDDIMIRLTDARLCAMAQRGDLDARDTLVRRYIDLVGMRAAAFYASAAQPHGFDREDLGQEGFIGLLSAIKNYNSECGASFKTFAARCIDGRITDVFKSESRKKRVPRSASVGLDDSVVADGSDPADRVALRDEIDRVLEAVNNSTSESERAVFYRFLGGMSYSQIAESMSMSVKSVENALGRVRKKIKSV